MNYTSNEKLGFWQIAIPVAVEAGKTGYNLYLDTINKERQEQWIESGLPELYSHAANQRADAATASANKSKTATYIAIGAAALIGILSLTQGG